MAKLTYEDRIEIYNKRKNGISLTTLSKQYGVHINKIKYLISRTDRNGLDVLRKNKKVIIIITFPNTLFPHQVEEII